MDIVQCIFLVKCLEEFNFGPDFICWVGVFYQDIKSCIINNDLTSNFFPLERGIRQGDLLSPYLFVIAIETLAIAIRQNPDIKSPTEKRTPKYPCKECGKGVRSNQDALLCVECNVWSHAKCINLSKADFKYYLDHPDLDWTCSLCFLLGSSKVCLEKKKI